MTRPGNPLPSGPPGRDFGRYRVVQFDEDVLITREGILGRGGALTFRSWCPEQIETALNNARTRSARQKARQGAEDLADELAAYTWALDLLRKLKERA